MYSRRTKQGVFVLEGLNTFATTYYLYYLFFYMHAKFGFGRLENLALAALNGFVYAFAAIYGGRFAQKRGYFPALRFGFSTTAFALIAGSAIESSIGQVCVMILATIGICFTWPALEALACEREPIGRLQRIVGIYNLVWAGGGALAYFSGGAMLEKWGLRSMFLVPAAINIIQLVFMSWIEKRAETGEEIVHRPSPDISSIFIDQQKKHSSVSPKTFLRIAWVANPCAYIAISTAVPLIPSLAEQLRLSPMFAGFFCSIWLFARALSFWILWLWTGWHYRFRWLAISYAIMAVCFALILIVPTFWALSVAQMFFGLALGLIYYSSLFYSMDVGSTKGEHGGIHEAAIGAGNFIGPAVGAAAVHFYPVQQNSGALAVSILLLCGFISLLLIRKLSSHAA